jgi:hypothetical protein
MAPEASEMLRKFVPWCRSSRAATASSVGWNVGFERSSFELGLPGFQRGSGV